MRAYRAMLTRVDAIRDGLGLEVDSEIRKTVALLNLLGHKTIQSCAGHTYPTHGDVSPWVDIEVNTKKQEQETRRLVRSYWHYRLPNLRPDAYSVWIYDNCPGVLRIRVGVPHFENIKKEKPQMPPSVRKWFVDEGRKEMKVFTEYVWKLYSGEEVLLKNPPKGLPHETL